MLSLDSGFVSGLRSPREKATRWYVLLLWRSITSDQFYLDLLRVVSKEPQWLVYLPARQWSGSHSGKNTCRPDNGLGDIVVSVHADQTMVWVPSPAGAGLFPRTAPDPPSLIQWVTSFLHIPHIGHTNLHQLLLGVGHILGN